MRPILEPGATCWRIERAHVGLLLDNQSYFRAFRHAVEGAKHTICLLGWQFDPRVPVDPNPAAPSASGTIGDVLQAAAAARPGVQIRLLVWDASLLISASRAFFPQRAKIWFDGRVRIHLDDRHPAGACHHQKIAAIDGAHAFCSSGDFAVNRWDTSAHLDHDRRRRMPSGEIHPPRHNVTLALEGPAATALSELAWRRWESATGERLEPGAADQGGDIWPRTVAADLGDCPVGIARTEPAFEGRPTVRENEALYLRSIAAARHLIYLESEYFASERIAEALQRRLAEPDGPEVIIVLSARSPGYFDRLTMDAARDSILERLEDRDPYGRLHIYSPVTPEGNDVIVHSKVTIVDDRLLRVGSSNLNNRSLGFDTECDVAVDAALASEQDRGRLRRTIREVLYRLIGHYVDAQPIEVAAHHFRTGSIAAAVRALQRNGAHHLRRLHGRRPGLFRALIARYHLGDPEGSEDAWRPWRRKGSQLRRTLRGHAAPDVLR